MFIYRRFSLFPVVMFYHVAVNIELMNTEPLLLERYRVRFLGASGHNIFINRSVQSSFHVSFCSKALLKICIVDS